MGGPNGATTTIQGITNRNNTGTVSPTVAINYYRDVHATKSATPGKLWTDDARHARLTTITTVDEIRQQLVPDANYMYTLKTGIDKVFELMTIIIRIEEAFTRHSALSVDHIPRQVEE